MATDSTSPTEEGDDLHDSFTDKPLTVPSDLVVGLIVIGLVCYVLLLGVKVIFF